MFGSCPCTGNWLKLVRQKDFKNSLYLDLGRQGIWGLTSRRTIRETCNALNRDWV